MEQSILISTKKLLGVAPDDESFDLDIITHINSAFSTLSDLGVGPEGGFVIEDDQSKWEDYLDGAAEDPNDPEHKVKLNHVKTFVYLHVKLLFDPPTSSYHLSATQEQLQEKTWRISTGREAYAWVHPDPPVPADGDDGVAAGSLILDGGEV